MTTFIPTARLLLIPAELTNEEAAELMEKNGMSLNGKYFAAAEIVESGESPPGTWLIMPTHVH